MVLAIIFCTPVYVIRYWIDVLCSPMDLSSKRSSRIDTIYSSGLIGFVILMAFTFMDIVVLIAVNYSDL